MESSVDSGAELFSLMEDRSALGQPKTPNIVEDDGRAISLQVLEFKTSLLEAVEELHIRRDAETRYEEQICKLVLEKQELEWQKESLQSQISRMSNENSESLATVKKQFQAQIRKIEGEKGKNQLAAELKDKENISLKEELKQLQLLRYSSEKKLGELEQKLQLQTQTKDSHLNQLGEVERRFSAISRQCAMVKQAHDKLELNVEEAMRINKKLTSINGKQESSIKALKEDLERVNKELVTFKVLSVCKPGEERLQNLLKEQEFQLLQQKLLVETELNKKLRHEMSTESVEKQEVLRSLHRSQSLLQRQTEALSRAEHEIRKLREEYQVLKTEHKLNQETTKEKDDSFARLRNEYQNSKLAWEKEILQLQMSTESGQEELQAVKKAYNQLQEEHKQLSISSVHKVKEIYSSEIAIKDKKNSLCTPSNEINLVEVSSLHEDLDESLISPHDNHEPTCHPDKDVPGKKERMHSCLLQPSLAITNIFIQNDVKCREGGGYWSLFIKKAYLYFSFPHTDESIEFQKARKDGCSQKNNKELDIPMQEDRTVPVVSPSVSTDNISRPEDVSPMMKHLSKLCDETKTGVSESEPVCNAQDKGCPSNPVQSDTDSCLAELSGPETRSVYGVDCDPLALKPKDIPLEQNLRISEDTESQTSNKHMDSQGYATSQSKEVKDHQNATPEFSQKQRHTVLLHDKTIITKEIIDVQPNPRLHEEPETNFNTVRATVNSDTLLCESKDKFSPPELICDHSQSEVSQMGGSTETSFYNVVNELESEKPPLADQSTSVTAADTEEVISENNDKNNDSETLKSQQIEVGVSTEEAKTTNPEQDPSSPGSTMTSEQSDADQKSIPAIDTLHHPGNRSYQSSFAWDAFMKGKKMPPPTPLKTKLWSSGFHELVSPFCAPIFTKNKLAKTAIMKTSNRLETPSKRPHQISDSQGEWNAIKQSFSEMLTEKENQVLISYSSALSGSPTSSFVGNGLRQNSTPTVPPPKLHSVEKPTQPMTCSSEEKEERKQSDIMAQIAKIEEFMSTEGLMPQKRLKTD
ncbi:coiled-coil domain-containing protein 73-like [Puntigrus tetrazona]|uniref:coiled-coil domain-containing protein 73-like n=1 Tax=Puntigrus tetrazona TaxID=1606681 RepID=UPI001C8993F8|nr:coiled-coil domain-containing protein 73-like [Puntigrus tetrazona]